MKSTKCIIRPAGNVNGEPKTGENAVCRLREATPTSPVIDDLFHRMDAEVRARKTPANRSAPKVTGLRKALFGRFSIIQSLRPSSGTAQGPDNHNPLATRIALP